MFLILFLHQALKVVNIIHILRKNMFNFKENKINRQIKAVSKHVNKKNEREFKSLVKFCKKQLEDETLAYIFKNTPQYFSDALQIIASTQVLSEKIQKYLLTSESFYVLAYTKNVTSDTREELLNTFLKDSFYDQEYTAFLNQTGFMSKAMLIKLFLRSPERFVEFHKENSKDPMALYALLKEITSEQYKTIYWAPGADKKCSNILQEYNFDYHNINYSFVKKLSVNASDASLNDFGKKVLRSCLKNCHLMESDFEGFEDTFQALIEVPFETFHDLVEMLIVLGPETFAKEPELTK